ncbi:uncharacterized protein PAC_15885 [Phialocephala subalpina]|uniref:Uncharacterized protein n=1 Tax=Phialocephala subalpina TaxID=576137 RepID=A0A1L7XLQ8_9HELO|nr:uncharacterized protein PAC_15885 [Phialocephala subalpina]
MINIFLTLVSNDFLHGGTPFDLAAVPLRHTSGKEDPLGHDYNMTLPGLDNLTDSMIQLQMSVISNQTQFTWKNISLAECLKRYGSGDYDTFSNVIVVSNWTSPSNENNSVLDLTILSGYAGPQHQTRQALVALCPDSFFSTNNITQSQMWKYASSKMEDFCDPYLPKNFNISQNGLFVKSCFSQEPKEVCRLLYSPLILKIILWSLVAMVACMALSLLLNGLGFGTEDPDPSKTAIHRAFTTVCLVFYAMVFVMVYSTAAHQSPKNKRFALYPFV